MLVGNGNTSFQDNKADNGATLHLSDSFLLFNFSSFQFRIINNFANTYGGAIFIDCLLSNANVTDYSIPMKTHVETICIT